jgi:hypothetical protein
MITARRADITRGTIPALPREITEIIGAMGHMREIRGLYDDAMFFHEEMPYNGIVLDDDGNVERVYKTDIKCRRIDYPCNECHQVISLRTGTPPDFVHQCNGIMRPSQLTDVWQSAILCQTKMKCFVARVNEDVVYRCDTCDYSFFECFSCRKLPRNYSGEETNLCYFCQREFCDACFNRRGNDKHRKRMENEVEPQCYDCYTEKNKKNKRQK